jgi:hypothetical protein
MMRNFQEAERAAMALRFNASAAQMALHAVGQLQPVVDRAREDARGLAGRENSGGSVGAAEFTLG